MRGHYRARVTEQLGNLRGEPMPYDEPHTTLDAGVEERMRAAGRLGLGDHLGLHRVDGQMEQRVVQHDDSGAGPGVARAATKTDEGFAGGIQIGPEAAW